MTCRRTSTPRLGWCGSLAVCCRRAPPRRRTRSLTLTDRSVGQPPSDARLHVALPAYGARQAQLPHHPAENQARASASSGDSWCAGGLARRRTVCISSCVSGDGCRTDPAYRAAAPRGPWRDLRTRTVDRAGIDARRVVGGGPVVHSLYAIVHTLCTKT